ncbi:MAG: hypothetical protein JWM59_758 [Verrucomicrobiales bacterium]|nr:hypothetical protein [Verrucomicrobiales bacterium]
MGVIRQPYEETETASPRRRAPVQGQVPPDYYSVESVRKIFRGRKLAEPPVSATAFGELACTIVRYEEEYQLNILPVVMSAVMRHPELRNAVFGDMVIYALHDGVGKGSQGNAVLPELKQDAVLKLKALMKPAELEFFRNWIRAIEGMPFTELCAREYARVREIWLDWHGDGSV